MANTISILITAKDNASRTLRGVSSQLDKGATSTGRADAAFAAFRRTAVVGMAAVGAATVAGLTSAVKSSATYESSLSKLKQSSSATGAQMQAMSSLARQLGRDNSLAGVTASDAALSMVELSKAGLSVKDTMGATRGVMSLAKAGNLEFADAAVIAASALNAFGLKGKDATKVADMLAAGANASQAELSDLAFGMQQSATVAKQFQLSLNENVTALALFANNGIRGSDAGTSLKTMLIALAKPSIKASDAMREIGFNAYDASGKFVGLDEMSVRLNKSLKGLTKQQQQNALATIFGTDAFRAAAVLADSAGAKYDKMSKSVGKAGAAQKAAAAQMGPFERATEGLSNQLSELGLSIGSRMLPVLTRATNQVSNFVQQVTGGLPGAIALFERMVPTIKSLSAGLLAFTVVQNAAGFSTKALTVAQGALNFVMRANPLSLVAGAAAAISVAYAGVISRTNGSTSAAQRLKMANDQLRIATNAVRNAQLQLRDAQLSQQGSSLQVERATQNLKQAISQYGRGSLEAREAAYQLKAEQFRLRDANEQVRQKALEAKNAINAQRNAAANAVAANNSAGAAANGAAAGYRNLTAAIQSAQAADKKSGGGFQNQAKQIANPKFLSGHASGTPYAPGGPTLVGERGPELVNLPRGSQVTQAYRTRQTLSEGPGAGTIIYEQGTYIFQTAEAVKEHQKGRDKLQRLAARGMG